MNSDSQLSSSREALAVQSAGVSRRGPSLASRAGFLVLASMVAPIFLAIAAWRTNSETYRHWLLTAFVTMYGATILIQYDPTGAGKDGVRHLLLVYEHYVGMSFATFLEDIWYVLTFQTPSHWGIRDVYKHVISYFVGGVLGAPQLFFTVVSFIYGYFFVGSMLEILRHVRLRKLNYLILGFVALFFLVKNVEGVNTVRTWTGLWVLMYAALKYSNTRNRNYILLMFTAPLIHFGYFLMVLPLLAVVFFGNHAKLYALLFAFSSVTTFINPGDIEDVTEAIASTETGAYAIKSYLVEDPRSLAERAEWALNLESRWYRNFQFLGVQKWALNIFVFTLLISGIYFSRMNYQQKTLFSIGLVTVAFSNMTWFFFAVSNRSWLIGCVFLLAAFIMARTNPATAPGLVRSVPGYYSFGLHLSLLVFVPYFLYNLTTILDLISIFMFVAPFLVWIDPEINTSLKEVLRALLGVG